MLNGFFSGWLLIDECGMLSALLLTLLASLASVPGNVRFVLFGDFNQLLPPMNRWRVHPVAGDAFQHSRLQHRWADGAEFRLTRCRRTQIEFCDFCQSLLTMPLAAAVQHCGSRFPPAKGHPLHLQGEMRLVISHRRRVKINKVCQEAAVKRYKAKTPPRVEWRSWSHPHRRHGWLEPTTRRGASSTASL